MFIRAIVAEAPSGANPPSPSIAQIVGIAVGVVLLVSAAAGVVRWWVSHRPVRVSVAIKVDGVNVLVAMENQRHVAEFAGQVTDARGINEKPAWPWTLGWWQSRAATQRIDRARSALVHVAGVRYLFAAKGNWMYSAPTSVQLTDPSGTGTRSLAIPPGDNFYVSWAGIELDIELSAIGHYGARALLTVRLRFPPDETGDKQIDAQIIRTGGGAR
ncbi:MAG TPA: hypothetical protein VIN65_09635 [Candidatus Dormibacteraeota bacterium]